MTHHLIAQSLNFRQEATDQAIPYAKETTGSAISTIIKAIMYIAVLTVFVYLILGAYEYITSGGEKGKIEGARSKITSAIVGLIILASSVAILLLVEKFLGIEFIRFV